MLPRNTYQCINLKGSDFRTQQRSCHNGNYLTTRAAKCPIAVAICTVKIYFWLRQQMFRKLWLFATHIKNLAVNFSCFSLTSLFDHYCIFELQAQFFGGDVGSGGGGVKGGQSSGLFSPTHRNIDWRAIHLAHFLLPSGEGLTNIFCQQLYPICL